MTFWQRLKEFPFHWMLTVVQKHQPLALRKFIEAEVNRISSKVSVTAAMMFLDKEGFLHCHFCPQRFGLRKVVMKIEGQEKEARLCLKHYAQSGASRTGELVNV
jgi:hypothetical protein